MNPKITMAIVFIQLNIQGRYGHNHIVVGFTTTYAISAYH